MQREILVVDPAVKVPETDCYNRIAETAPAPCSYHLPKFTGMDALERIQAKPLAIIVLGSSSSVNDKFDWQIALGSWLKKHMDAGIPTLGLCFGHQLIAHLYGAPVREIFTDGRKHLGFRAVQLQQNRLWGAAATGKLTVSHKEAVMECPAGFEVVGKSPEVPIDAIAHKTLPIWGFQSHPEATALFLKYHSVPPSEDPKCFEFGYGLIARFLELVKS
ncbi:gamma-glutamyl-gamma-aminobutyrate hydrolase family protein [bacterium]|nr:gamma-glutamyl-gamma-aminobutyrate hydrolase family protein [bacterium]